MGVSAHPYKKKDKNQINTNKIMEQNMTTIPFDLELAKKINNGEYNGTIVTAGRNFRVELVYYKEDGIYPILGVVHTDHGIISDWFSSNGYGSKNYKLKLMVPEYTTFKDGNLLSNEDGSYLFILNTNGEYLTSLHASLNKFDILTLSDGFAANKNNIGKYRLATDLEARRMINALKACNNPKAKEYLKRFFGIDKDPKYDFKPFDKVLVKYCEEDNWKASFFIRTVTDDQNGGIEYECLNGVVYAYCIPYEGNESLLQTNTK